MGQAEIVVVGLLVAVVGLSALARRLALPYPIVLVLGGALLGFVPGLPEVRLDPEVVLLVFLPPRPSGSAAPLSTATSGASTATPLPVLDWRASRSHLSTHPTFPPVVCPARRLPEARRSWPWRCAAWLLADCWQAGKT
jgi:hypothetical protein